MKKALLILAFAALCVSCGNRNTEEVATPAADSTKACCGDSPHTHADSTKACCDSTKVK